MTPDDIARCLDHRSRRRLSRFWRVAGPLLTGQLLFGAGLFVAFFIFCIRNGHHLIALAVILAPAVAAYFTRPILLARPNLAVRLMNITVLGCLAYGLLFYRGGVSLLAMTLVGYLSFHISGLFWILSDTAVCPRRRRWWHC